MTFLFLALNISTKVLKSKVYTLNSGLVGLSIRQPGAGVISCSSSSCQLFIEERCKEKMCKLKKDQQRCCQLVRVMEPRKDQGFLTSAFSPNVLLSLGLQRSHGFVMHDVCL